jgi:hypothetical protein
MTSRSRLIGVAALCCLLTLATSAPAQAPNSSPSDILANPGRFDGQPVTISGTIAYVEERVSQSGNPYYTVDLSDGKRTIRVFSFGTATCRAGHAAIVEGTFKTVTQQSGYTFYNEVAATRVTCR